MQEVDDLRGTPKGEGWCVLPLAFGLFCAWAQFTLLRDFLSLTGGRVLWVGWFLGVWLIAGGLPMLITGRMKDKRISPWVAVLIGITVITLPFISLILQWLPEKLTAHAGLPVPLLLSLGLGAGVSGVMSFLLGFVFLAIRSRMHADKTRSRTATLYIWETAGFAIGAVLFIATAGWGGHLLKAIIIGAFLPTAFIVDVLLRGNKGRLRGDLVAAGLAFVPLILLVFTTPQVERGIVVDRYADLGEAHRIETQYGRLVRVDAKWNHSFYRDGGLLFTTDDYDYAEELAHLVLLQHPNPRDILILGLGSDRIPFEALKYPDSRITLVEPDKSLLRQWMSLREDEIDNGRMVFINEDPREFIEDHPGGFDAVLFSHACASDLSSNRLLTREGLSVAHSALRKGGILGLGLEAEENYSDPVAITASATVFKSLEGIFDTVLVTPLYTHIFIASDAPKLNLDPIVLGERMESRGIQGMFLNRYTLLDRLPPERTEGLREALSAAKTGSNSDLNPLTFRLAYQLEMLRESPTLARFYRWLSDNDGVIQIIILLIGAGAGLLFSMPNKPSGRAFIAASSAFLLMGGVLLLVLLWQNIGGGLITHVAVITTAAMLGAAAGAWAANRGSMPASELTVALIERILVLEMILLIVAMLLLTSAAEWLALVIILAFALIIPATVGCQFAMLCRMITAENHSDAPLYGWDLLGASIGSIAISFLLLPLASYPIIALILTTPKFFQGYGSNPLTK